MRWSPIKGKHKSLQNWPKRWLPGAMNKTRLYYQRAGSPGLQIYPFLKKSFLRFVEMRGMESAAGLAYYALFSLFPLTLILVSIAGFVIGNDLAYARVVEFIRSVVPFSGEVLDENLKEVVKLRGPVGMIGALAMLWSASGFFDTLANSINRAWPMVKLRSYVQNRLVALAMIGGLLLLLIMSLVSSTLLSLLPTLTRLLDTDPEPATLDGWAVILRVVPALFTLMMFIVLYRWVPNKTVHWRAVLPGAAVTAFAWELARQVFSMYLSNGIARYEMIYGSLGALIALMVWIYVSDLIAVLGAYLVASLDMLVDQEDQLVLSARQIAAPEIQEVRAPEAGIFRRPQAAEPVQVDTTVTKETRSPKRVRG